eukprot:scaffold5332_cov403-Prasinococcus_capsulatus_cf.AAC.3
MLPAVDHGAGVRDEEGLPLATMCSRPCHVRLPLVRLRATQLPPSETLRSSSTPTCTLGV